LVEGAFAPLVAAAGAGGDLRAAFSAADALAAALAPLGGGGGGGDGGGALAPAPPPPLAPALVGALAQACALAGQPRRAEKVLEWGAARGATAALTWRAREAVVAALAARGDGEGAAAALEALRGAEAAGAVGGEGGREGGGVGEGGARATPPISGAAYAAVVGAMAGAGDPRGALAALRRAQMAGALRHWDLSLHKGVLNAGGLPLPALPALLPDALRSLRRAVAARAVPPPAGGLRVYHGPAQRAPLRALLAAEGLPARAHGLRAEERHLWVPSAALVGFLTEGGEEEGGGGGSGRGSGSPRGGDAPTAAAAATRDSAGALLAATRPLGARAGKRAPPYTPAALAVMEQSHVPPRVELHGHPLQLKSGGRAQQN
jgi:hypothetical protein